MTAHDWHFRLADGLVGVALFLLPWQMRYIFSSPALAGGPWEYGIGSVYAIEILIVIAAFLRHRQICAWIKPVRGPLLACGGVWALSASVGAAPLISFGFLWHILCAMVFAVLLVVTPMSRNRLVAIFIAGLLPAAALAWFQVSNGWSPASTWLGLALHAAKTSGTAVIETKAGRLLRGYGPYPHPNIFGGVLVFGIGACLWLAGRVSSRRARGSLAIAAAVLSATLIITFSRSAFLALGVMILVFIFKKGKRIVMTGIIIGLLAAAFCFRVPLLSRADMTNRLEQKSTMERGNQYKEFAAVFSSAPFLGTGPGAYTAALAHLFPGSPSWAYQPIHNALLLMVAELGIWGSFALAWLSVSCLRLLRSRQPSSCNLYPLLPLLLFDHYVWSSWAGLGLVALCALYRPLTAMPFLPKMGFASSLDR